jgi:hypothetical protein
MVRVLNLLESRLQTRQVTVQRWSINSTKPFESVVAAVEGALGRPNMTEFAAKMGAATTYEEMKEIVQDSIGKRLKIHGFWMYYEEYLPKIRAALTEASKVVASGKLSLPMTTIYKASQIKQAIEHSQRGGKILLDFNHTN